MTEKLKPCPFCGGRTVLLGNEEISSYFVLCEDCDAEGKTCNTPEEAIVKAWDNHANFQENKSCPKN